MSNGLSLGTILNNFEKHRRRRLYLLSLLSVFVISMSSSAYSHDVSGKDTIDLALIKLADTVKAELGEHEREDIARQIVLVCEYDGAEHIGKKGIDAVASLLSDKSDFVKALSLKALECIGPPANYTIPLLRKAAQDEEEGESKEPGAVRLRMGWYWTDEIPAAIAKMTP